MCSKTNVATEKQNCNSENNGLPKCTNARTMTSSSKSWRTHCQLRTTELQKFDIPQMSMQRRHSETTQHPVNACDNVDLIGNCFSTTDGTKQQQSLFTKKFNTKRYPQTNSVISFRSFDREKVGMGMCAFTPNLRWKIAFSTGQTTQHDLDCVGITRPTRSHTSDPWPDPTLDCTSFNDTQEYEDAGHALVLSRRNAPTTWQMAHTTNWHTKTATNILSWTYKLECKLQRPTDTKLLSTFRFPRIITVSTNLRFPALAFARTPLIPLR